ncbi:reticulon-like protein B16 isoform X2 [Sesamum indicum]|uniref:Reticulon-like protein n=1 Tax=Sesamum indicum TaxID=4182 RepID=A0A6I9TU79_SESIN|nr:reticulon-like protein B16 isoform X2 [Sesamum indicum]
MENSNSEDLCGVEQNEECRINDPASTSSSYRLFGRQASVHQMMGGGKAADVILWRRRHASFGILLVATFSWLLIERSGISFLSLCSDVLLILIVLLFLKANYAVFRKKQPKTLPELVLSEEMVVIALWLLSVIGSLISFFTLAYIGIILSITIPALYDKFEDHVDRFAGMIHRKFSKHYKIVDESLQSRLPRTLAKEKDP